MPVIFLRRYVSCMLQTSNDQPSLPAGRAFSAPVSMAKSSKCQQAVYQQGYYISNQRSAQHNSSPGGCPDSVRIVPYRRPDRIDPARNADELLLRQLNISEICLIKAPAALSSSVADATASPSSSSAHPALCSAHLSGNV